MIINRTRRDNIGPRAHGDEAMNVKAGGACQGGQRIENKYTRLKEGHRQKLRTETRDKEGHPGKRHEVIGNQKTSRVMQ